MKKFISIFLCTVVFTVNAIFTPYATTVYAAGTAVDIVKSISLDNVVKMVKSLYKVGYNVATTGSGDGAASSKALDSIWGEDSAVNKWLQTKLFPFMDSNGNIDLTNPDSPITYDKDKQLVEFNPTFTTELNQQLQDSIHALDGYYIIEPENRNSPSAIAEYHKFSGDSDAYKFIVNAYNSATLAYTVNGNFHGSQYILYQDFYLYLCYENNRYRVDSYDPRIGDSVLIKFGETDKGACLAFDYHENPYFHKINFGPTLYYDSNKASDLTAMLPNIARYCWGRPFKLFYSKQALLNYIGKGRTYVPQLPSGGFKVNIKYINNTTNLPDITYNITTENKTETEIQNQFDTTFNNYLNDLNDFTDGGGGTTNPTPTPSGGGSGGDFGDGTTPTPKPDFTDGSLTDTNTLLQKILDKLTEFSTNHDKLAKTITDYIQKNDGKLEEILIAIQALSDGKTETEQNGCKYDFTALSKYLTDLWNNSDKKFDEMVKLLEENNKYQQKLVDSLNEIKALLIADTVMDFFKDRSQETAEKAKDKFPTSIPWDVSLVLNSMSAEPKNPKFSLPIKIESFKINETIDIDLSTGEWEKLAKTCRYILSVTFILFLIHLSRKLFSNGGDD